jgi:hypothetical protein
MTWYAGLGRRGRVSQKYGHVERLRGSLPKVVAELVYYCKSSCIWASQLIKNDGSLKASDFPRTSSRDEGARCKVVCQDLFRRNAGHMRHIWRTVFRRQLKGVFIPPKLTV